MRYELPVTNILKLNILITFITILGRNYFIWRISPPILNANLY